MEKHIVSFSGGKDSTALLLWAKETLSKFDAAFCDTGWEDPITYSYIKYISENVHPVLILKPEFDFIKLAIKKKRFPSAMARFCTEHLKLKPMKDYIDQFQKQTVTLHLGVRAEESFNRASLPTNTVFDDGFYNCYISRPLLKWSAADCFDLLEKYNIEPNPLYKMGMKRVGCMPCVMTNHVEMRNIIKYRHDIIAKLREAEESVGRTFFRLGTFLHVFAVNKIRNPKLSSLHLTMSLNI